MLQSSERKSVHARQLTAKAPENGWLEDDEFPFGARPIFRGKLLVSGRVASFHSCRKRLFHCQPKTSKITASGAAYCKISKFQLALDDVNLAMEIEPSWSWNPNGEE